MDIVEYAEQEAKANAAFHISITDALMRESNTLLNLLLAGAGGSVAYAVNLTGKAAWQQWGMATTAVYLFIVAAMVLFYCLQTESAWPPANEPKNFPLSGYTLNEVREGELASRQRCIDRNRLRNEQVGVWLNRCRALAVAAPIAFSVGAFWLGH
ncbi:MAG: hypothetical protein ABI351_08980 [Herbaspirillum sp.]